MLRFDASTCLRYCRPWRRGLSRPFGAVRRMGCRATGLTCAYLPAGEALFSCTFAVLDECARVGLSPACACTWDSQIDIVLIPRFGAFNSSRRSEWGLTGS